MNFQSLLGQWWRRKKRRPSNPPYLICMRLDEMVVVHPQQITKRCTRCDHDVGIYPSGQRALKWTRKRIVICRQCAAQLGLASAHFAPGFETEPFESVWRL